MLYNPEGNEIRVVCNKISQKFEDRLKTLIAKRRTEEMDDKASFSSNFSRLQPDQLRHIVVELKKEFPYCVVEVCCGFAKPLNGRMKAS